MGSGIVFNLDYTSRLAYEAKTFAMINFRYGFSIDARTLLPSLSQKIQNFKALIL